MRTRGLAGVVALALCGASSVACTLFFPDRELDTSEDAAAADATASDSGLADDFTDADASVAVGTDGAASDGSGEGASDAATAGDVTDAADASPPFCQRPEQATATFCADFESDASLSAWSASSGDVRVDSQNRGPLDAGASLALTSTGGTAAKLGYSAPTSFSSQLEISFSLFEDNPQPSQNDYILEVDVGGAAVVYFLVGFGGMSPQIEALDNGSNGGGGTINATSPAWSTGTWLQVDMTLVFGSTPNVSVSVGGTRYLDKAQLDAAFSGGLTLGNAIVLESNPPSGSATATYHFADVVIRGH